MLIRPAMLAVLALVAPAVAEPADDGRWHTGAYAYASLDAHLEIVGISGTGTREDPVIITHEMTAASPATIEVSSTGPIRPAGVVGIHATGMLHIRIVALNATGLPWVEYGMELESRAGRPSSFGDGLSFDQRRMESGAISSSEFAEYSRDFEPSDRIQFRDGHVDPGQEARFEVFVSDFTPAWRFYLVQDPSVPLS